MGQGLLARDDVVEAEKIEAELEGLDAQIGDIAAWLDDKSLLSEQIDSLGAHLDQPNRFYSSRAAHEPDRRKYAFQVQRWNAELGQYQAEAARHDELVDQYNGLVDEYNTVAEAAYSRWWLIPIPAPRRAGRAARQVGSVGGP